MKVRTVIGKGSIATLLVVAGLALPLLDVVLIALTKGKIFPMPLRAALGQFGVAGLLAPALMFWICALPLFSGTPHISRTVRYAFVVLVGCSIVYWCGGWSYAVFKFGMRLLLQLVTLNVLSVAGLWALAVHSSRSPSVLAATLFNWLFVLWTWTIAFPKLW